MIRTLAKIGVIVICSLGATMDPWLDAETDVEFECWFFGGDLEWDLYIASHTHAANWSNPGYIYLSTSWELGCAEAGCLREDSYEREEQFALSVYGSDIGSGQDSSHYFTSLTATAWSSHSFASDGFDDSTETYAGQSDYCEVN